MWIIAKYKMNELKTMKEKFNGTTAAEGIKVKVVNLRKDIKKELNNNRKDKNDKTYD